MNKRKNPEPTDDSPHVAALIARDGSDPSAEVGERQVSEVLTTGQLPGAGQDKQRRNTTVITHTDGNVPFYNSVKELMDVGALLVISRT